MVIVVYVIITMIWEMMDNATSINVQQVVTYVEMIHTASSVLTDMTGYLVRVKNA